LDLLKEKERMTEQALRGKRKKIEKNKASTDIRRRVAK